MNHPSDHDVAQPAKTKTGNRKVQDRKCSVYTLIDKIGEGGQGVVCKTDIPGTLIKIYRGKTEQKNKDWSRHVQWLMRQNLSGLNLARPVEMIAKPASVHAYVMELMDGLEPLEDTVKKTHQTLLECEENPLDGFIRTGGLKRRILLLRELARTLAGLHSRGYAYGDLSPANIFISQSVEYHQLWLIDCDNICVSERSGFQHFYTPGYGAPEVVRNDSGVNVLTDSWSFAVIALKLLTNNHPFLNGLGMEEAEEGDGGADLFSEQAAQGEVPWIYDEDDDSNAWDEGGIPLEIVTTRLMRQLFQRCFGSGRESITDRPTMSEWLDALDAASTHFLNCNNPDCSNTFFYNKVCECPFCEQTIPEQSHLLLRYYLYNEEPFEDQSPWLSTPSIQVINAGDKIDLHLAPMGTDNYYDSPLICSVELENDGLFIEPAGNSHVELQRTSDGKTHHLLRKQRLNTASRKGERMALHLRNDDMEGFSAHPVWTFIW